ncbi:MAG: type II/IV secretion system protein [Deltaproteobacteria bacterium]|nr:type II/IV secretion system protein [Deltaproteobacteria bacterium]
MNKFLGEILIELGFIDESQLKMALDEKNKTGSLLGDVLLRLDWVTEEQLQTGIAIQSGAKILDIQSIIIDQSLMSDIPMNFAVEKGIFPLEKIDNVLKVATSNPFDVITQDELARMTGLRVETFIAPKEWISETIDLYYKAALTIDENIEKISRTNAGIEEGDTDHIIKLANLLIDKGYVLEASDIHVVADTKLARIYYRVDGVLQQNYLFNKSFHKGLVQRFKIMGDMDISKSHVPQDGRIQYAGHSGEIDIRVSTFPTQFGETVVMRLLRSNKGVGPLTRLGFEDDDLERYTKTLNRPYGLILVTGPTGSGKTSSLYSSLMSILSPNINVMTIEDPIEYVIPTIRQTAVNPKAGLTFATALRSAMRQDPDVILVGEIRDQETAELALSASMTGHLVLSTLHTNDAVSGISRLLDLGASPNVLASAVTMIIAQRLIRRVCSKCLIMTPAEEEERNVFIRNGIDPPDELPRHVGCESCHNTGYVGRSGVYEVLIVDREIEQMIAVGAPTAQIEETAVKAGTTLMIKQALKKVARKITTLEEVHRVIADA